MRQLLFLFLAFVLISATAEEKIVGTWEVYKKQGRGNTKKIEEKIQLTFDAQGNFVIKEFSNREKLKTGKFVYDEPTKTLYIEERARTNVKQLVVLKLTKNKLIIGPSKDSNKKGGRLYLKKIG